MTEQRATDWKGPVALVLAGLALLVALSGRGFGFDGPRNWSFRAEAAPVPVQPPVPPAPPEAPVPPDFPYGMMEPMPMMPIDPDLRQEMRDMWREMWGAIDGELKAKGKPFDPAQPMKPMEPIKPMPVPPQGDYYFDSGDNVFDRGWGFVLGVYHYIQPLLQLALLALLGVILFTWLRRRSRPAYPTNYQGYQGYPPPPPAAPPVQGQGQGQGSDTPPAGYPGPGVLD